MSKSFIVMVRRCFRLGLAVVTLGVAVLWDVSPASAGGNRISDYEAIKDQGGEQTMYSELDAMILRLIGAYEGIGWVNVLYLQENKPPVFCPPDDFVVSIESLRDMIDVEIRDHSFSQMPYPKDMPMDAIVMFAAITRFPCH